MRLIPVRQAARLLKKFPKQDRIQEMTLLTRKKDRSLTVSWQTAGAENGGSATAPKQKKQRLAYTSSNANSQRQNQAPIAYTSPNAASQSSSEPDPSTPQILVIEDGYEHSQLLFEPGADLNRYLKAAFKREFPRSHQAYLVEKK